MPDRDTAVAVRGLSKNYTIIHSAPKHTTLTEALLHTFRKPLARPDTETFWALRDVEFDIKKGDVVGIIGRNGAGKSTLLKVLSRITEPTTGQIDLYGRVGSLLEVGTGFHPELTGRENIYMNGAILGMSKREITQHFDEIVAFAEVEQFLDTPVKRYSSGMYVRLAFAVAAHLNPEILIVDEVLAVGDAEFQKKCLGKMQDVSREDGRTVLFVSHNMTAVQFLCNRVVMLQGGRVAVDGDVGAGVSAYQAAGSQAGREVVPGQNDLSLRKNSHSPGELIVRQVVLRGSRGQTTSVFPMGAGLSLVIGVDGLSRHRNARVGVKVHSDQGQWLLGINTEMRVPQVRGPRREQEQVVLDIPRFPLTPGVYWIDIDIDQPGGLVLDHVERAARLEVVESDFYGTGSRVENGVAFLDADWRIEDAEASAASLSAA